MQCSIVWEIAKLKNSWLSATQIRAQARWHTRRKAKEGATI